MTEHEALEQQANPYAKQILIFTIACGLLVCLVFDAPALSAARVPAAILLPFCLAYWTSLALRLYRTSSDAVPPGPLVAGVAFAVGGVALDGAATLAVTPDLSQEGNSIARCLLDSGCPVNLVVLYCIAAQALLMLFICALWAAFLRHKNTLLALAQGRPVKSAPEFIKAALGGGKLSWRQFLLPIRLREFVASYYLVWILAVGLVWGSLDRWCLGFQWLGWFTVPPTARLSLSIGLPILGYLAWLWHAYSTRPVPQRP